MVAYSYTKRLATGALTLAVGLGLAVSAQAQQMSTNSASYNAGYGRTAGQENRGTDYGTRDGNGNRVIVDGIIQTGQDQSLFSRSSGVFDSVSGVGGIGGSSTAIGNNLVVVTQGSWNTVIVNSVQTNTGDVTAGTSTSGGNHD
ncbi:MAG: holdfast anchoring protein HfaA [Caulobacter sp.]|nr:holdfast anchoring protein HfaA [Caulobacter sp.]